MDPMTLALLAGGGTLLSGLGSTIQARQPYQDTLAGWLKEFNSQQGAPAGNRDLNYANSSAFYKQLTNGGSMDPNSYLQRATGYAGNASDIYNGVLKGYAPGGAYTAQGMQNTFAGLNPQIQGLASGVADQATSRFGSSMESLARAESGRALSNMQNRLGAGGLFGVAAGPVAASLSQGAQEPLMQAQNAINQMYNNSYMGAYNPMAAFSMGNIQAEPSAQANIGQLYAALAGQQYGAANPLISALGGMSEQALMAPDMQQRTSGLASMLSGLGNTASQLGMFGLGQGWNGKGLGSTGGTGGNNYSGYNGYMNPWAAGWRSQ